MPYRKEVPIGGRIDLFCLQKSDGGTGGLGKAMLELFG
jgi:hypothetical protein